MKGSIHVELGGELISLESNPPSSTELLLDSRYYKIQSTIPIVLWIESCPPKRYAVVLTPSISEYDCIWK